MNTNKYQNDPTKLFSELPSALQQRINELEDLKENWDGYGAEKSNTQVLNHVRTLLQKLSPRELNRLDAQDVYPYPHGIIALSWSSPINLDSELILEVGETTVSFMVEYPNGDEDGKEFFNIDDTDAWDYFLCALKKLHDSK